MSDEAVQVALEAPRAGVAAARRLDHTTMRVAASEPESFRHATEKIDGDGSPATLDLPPFGLVTVDGAVAPGSG
jgi:hypothetical protein